MAPGPRVSESECVMNQTEVPLPLAPAHRDLRVCALRGSNGYTQRLRELGLLEGKTVRIVINQDPIVCVVGTSRLALGRQLAECVRVEPVNLQT